MLAADAVAAFMERAPAASKRFIADGNRPTCEDMTLHWVHASAHPSTPPIWIELSTHDALDLDTVVPSNGTASGEMHLDVVDWAERRAACVDRLADEFGNFPLTRSVCRVELRTAKLEPRPTSAPSPRPAPRPRTTTAFPRSETPAPRPAPKSPDLHAKALSARAAAAEAALAEEAANARRAERDARVARDLVVLAFALATAVALVALRARGDARRRR